MSDQVDDDFDDRADLATADETIRLLRAEVTCLRERAEAERQQWRSRMGLTTSTDEAVRIAVEEERKALRKAVLRVAELEAKLAEVLECNHEWQKKSEHQGVKLQELKAELAATRGRLTLQVEETIAIRRMWEREDVARAAAERRVEKINREHSETMNIVLEQVRVLQEALEVKQAALRAPEEKP